MSNLIAEIRRKSPGEEIDYTFIMDCLKNYGSPRAKLTSLLKKGDLIRVKKGLYVFGPDYRKSPYSPEIMANKIYGPSYVSREYALAYYGLIPEHVIEVTNVTTKRNRHFDTSIGRFNYRHLPEKFYSIGFNLVEVRGSSTALMATPEKALADLLYFRDVHLESVSELEDLLFEDLRLEEIQISKMRIGIFSELAKAGYETELKFLIEWIKRKK